MPARPRSTSAEQLRRRNRELSILNAIADALNRQVDLHQSLQTVLEQVATLLDLHTGWIWLIDAATNEPYLAAEQHLPRALTQQPTAMEGRCYCLDTFASGDLAGAANINVITCTRLKNVVDDSNNLRYHASIPLYAHGEKLGVLNVASPDWRMLSPDDLRLLHTVGDLLSIAIQRAQLFAVSVNFGASEERNRLAREIHDTLAQGLTAVALRLETADALLDAGADATRIQQTVRDALALTRANLDAARRSVLDLRAAPLEGRTLAQALVMLGAQATTNNSANNVPVRVSTTGASRPLPSRVEVGVYRIAQEAVTNAQRHAAGTTIHLALVMTPTELRLTIDDDGQGFDPEHVAAERFGLTGMMERAKLLSGTVRIESEPGQGTQIMATIPLEVR